MREDLFEQERQSYLSCIDDLRNQIHKQNRIVMITQVKDGYETVLNITECHVTPEGTYIKVS